MVKFIKSTVTPFKIPYEGMKQNFPVNIYLCKSLKKTNERNGWGSEYFGIKFEGCNTMWYFKTEKEREDEFNMILDITQND